MIIWIGAHFSLQMVSWLKQSFNLDACHARDLGPRDSEIEEVFSAARKPMRVMTKDIDFFSFSIAMAPPPQVLWITCGNTSNAHLKSLLSKTVPNAL